MANIESGIGSGGRPWLDLNCPLRNCYMLGQRLSKLFIIPDRHYIHRIAVAILLSRESFKDINSSSNHLPSRMTGGPGPLEIESA